MIRRASPYGWIALAGAAMVASLGDLAMQLGFTVMAVGIVGMAHGASDLAIVPPVRRPMFLLLYASTGALCLVWWMIDPGIALPVFLVVSAVHFGLEDAPDGNVLERIARGVSLIATPATLHATSLSDILLAAGAPPHALPVTTGVLAIAGAVTGGALIAVGVRRGDWHLSGGTLALMVLPPLIGFSIGFLVLHALPQTMERKAQLGCPSMSAYLRYVGPVLVAAVILVALIGATMLSRDPSGVRPLFAAIAALAIPHLLVTPWFASPATSVRTVLQFPTFVLHHPES